MRRRPYLWVAPHVRGRATSRILTGLERSGLRIHRIGQAAYAHGRGLHLIFGVWDPGEPPPAWADRLGQVSDAYLRRWHRRARDLRWLRYARDEHGRWVGLRPWWQWPIVGAYEHEGIRWPHLEGW